VISVVLVDDHEMVRAGLRQVLEQQGTIDVVGEAASVEEAIAVIRRRQPDVAVVDLRLLDGSGLAVCTAIRDENLRSAPLVLTSFADDEALVEAASCGARAYVLKRARSAELVETIAKVASGANLLDSATVRQASRKSHGDEGDRLDLLTDRESSIVELIARGYSNREIAEELYLAEKTVKNYITNLLAKLGLRRRTEVAALVTRRNEQRRQRGEFDRELG
jgi:DNA-binding NarL/FixJ family response regulator